MVFLFSVESFSRSKLVRRIQIIKELQIGFWLLAFGFWLV